jgi:hypothetical protein
MNGHRGIGRRGRRLLAGSAFASVCSGGARPSDQTPDSQTVKTVRRCQRDLLHSISPAPVLCLFLNFLTPSCTDFTFVRSVSQGFLRHHQPTSGEIARTANRLRRIRRHEHLPSAVDCTLARMFSRDCSQLHFLRYPSNEDRALPDCN